MRDVTLAVMTKPVFTLETPPPSWEYHPLLLLCVYFANFEIKKMQINYSNISEILNIRFCLFKVLRQFIVSNRLIIMEKIIFENNKRRVLFFAAKIDFLGQNGVRALEPSLMGL